MNISTTYYEWKRVSTSRTKEKAVIIDDTTAFGVNHHNHSLHRIYIEGLSWSEAKAIKEVLDDTTILLADDSDVNMGTINGGVGVSVGDGDGITSNGGAPYTLTNDDGAYAK